MGIVSCCRYRDPEKQAPERILRFSEEKKEIRKIRTCFNDEEASSNDIGHAEREKEMEI